MNKDICFDLIFVKFDLNCASYNIIILIEWTIDIYSLNDW